MLMIIVGIAYRYQTLICLGLSVDIEILFYTMKYIIFAPTDPSVIKSVLLTYKIYKT